MKILAAAKVNLYLRVLGKRKDGYHEIDSVMLPVDLYDEIEISEKKKGNFPLSVSCAHPLVPGGKRNLAYQAAALLKDRMKVRKGASIRIRKRIPVGAGLGGGSTDAAATLLGLNRLWGLGCSRRALQSMARGIGADVPFFIAGRPARVRGMGEKVTAISAFPQLWMVILYPGFPVSTRWIYEHLSIPWASSTLTRIPENTSMIRGLGVPENLRDLLVNDLEEVAVGRHPQIGLLKEKLLAAGAVGAVMTGSGSSVFGVFSSEDRARDAFRRLQESREAEAYLVRSLA